MIIRKIFLLAFLLVSFSCSSEEKIAPEEETVLQEEGGTKVNVGEKKQSIYLGIDAERLWHWRSNIKDELAQLAVGDLQAKFVRVAINCAYEREKGHKDESAYDMILESMTAMKKVNPDIEFFATPRPLHEAYSDEEKEEIWGHTGNVPWSPYPTWILEFVADGTRKMPDGTIVPKFVEKSFDIDALVQYFADYLNLMHAKGFKISYMDITQERQTITPELNLYLYQQIPQKLNSGVHMPLLVLPSTWNREGGIKWLKSVDATNNEAVAAIGIAATHNTDPKGSSAEFVNEATKLGKISWNTELHGWIGTEVKDEVLNSEIFWTHLREGFVGLDTWLFFGPLGGTSHSMINSHWNNKLIKKTTKYEIFKIMVNHANGGNYVDIDMPDASVITTAFVKDDILSIWVLNKSKETKELEFALGKWEMKEQQVICRKWNGEFSESGLNGKLTAKDSYTFTRSIDAESLYFFKVELKH